MDALYNQLLSTCLGGGSDPAAAVDGEPLFPFLSSHAFVVLWPCTNGEIVMDGMSLLFGNLHSLPPSSVASVCSYLINDGKISKKEGKIVLNELMATTPSTMQQFSLALELAVVFVAKHDNDYVLFLSDVACTIESRLGKEDESSPLQKKGLLTAVISSFCIPLLDFLASKSDGKGNGEKDDAAAAEQLLTSFIIATILPSLCTSFLFAPIEQVARKRPLVCVERLRGDRRRKHA